MDLNKISDMVINEIKFDMPDVYIIKICITTIKTLEKLKLIHLEE